MERNEKLVSNSERFNCEHFIIHLLTDLVTGCKNAIEIIYNREPENCISEGFNNPLKYSHQF